MSNRLLRLRCSNCGGEIEETDIYCPQCGLNLDPPPGKSEHETLAQENLQIARDLLESGHSLKKALAACDLAITCTPESAKAHNLRGLILDGLGRMAEAIPEYREALRLEPDFAEAKANLEDALRENGNAQMKNTHGSVLQPKRNWKTILKKFV